MLRLTQINQKKRKRGLSKDQIGIMCTIDRNGNIIAEPISRGMASAEAIENLFKDRMGEDIIACVDSCRSFIKFAKNTGIELQRIKSGKKKRRDIPYPTYKFFPLQIKDLVDEI